MPYAEARKFRQDYLQKVQKSSGIVPLATENVASQLGITKPKNKRKRRAAILSEGENVGNIYRPMAYETLG